jgi:N,N-dimethylformamidase
MCFVGALPVDGYDNLLARMMTNAVKRFVDPAPFQVGSSAPIMST